MTATVGDLIQWNGRPARIARREYGPDNPHPRDTEGEAWDGYPLDGDGWWVVEYLPGEAAAAEEPTCSPAPVTDRPRVPRPPEGKGSGLAFHYLKEVTRAHRPELGNADIVFLVTMLGYCTGETLRDCRPGHARLMADRDFSDESSVRREIAKLRKLRYVLELSPGHHVGRATAAEYELILPEWDYKLGQ